MEDHLPVRLDSVRKNLKNLAMTLHVYTNLVGTLHGAYISKLSRVASLKPHAELATASRHPRHNNALVGKPQERNYDKSIVLEYSILPSIEFNIPCCCFIFSHSTSTFHFLAFPLF